MSRRPGREVGGWGGRKDLHNGGLPRRSGRRPKNARRTRRSGRPRGRRRRNANVRSARGCVLLAGWGKGRVPRFQGGWSAVDMHGRVCVLRRNLATGRGADRTMAFGRSFAAPHAVSRRGTCGAVARRRRVPCGAGDRAAFRLITSVRGSMQREGAASRRGTLTAHACLPSDHSLIHAVIIHSFVQVFVHSLIRSLIYSFILSFIHSLVHSFSYSVSLSAQSSC